MTKNYKIIFSTILVLFILGFIGQYKFYKNEVKRLDGNIKSEKLKHARLQTLTRKEFKLYEDSIASLVKQLDIKIKNVKTITVIKYEYKDTLVTSYKTVYDTVRKVDKFDISKNCFELSGIIYNGGIDIETINIKDKLTTFIHKDYDKQFLFVKWKPFYTTKVYSKCKNDVVSVEKHINLIKYKRSWKKIRL